MNNFPRNRYSPNEILKLFDQAEMQEVQGDFFKSIEANGEELEIYFCNKDGEVDEKHISSARSILTHIKELDNLVQDSCETEYKNSNFHVRNFMLYLAIIEINEDEVSFRYYGERVNTEWGATFRENDKGIWEKVNF